MGFEIAASEDGLLEQSQNIVLLLATLIFAVRAYRSGAVDRAICVGAALLCAVFFFREAEFPPDAPFAAYLSSPAFRWHEAAVVFAIVAPYAALRRQLAPNLFRYAASSQAWPFFLAGILLVIGYWFDKFGSRYMDVLASRFWEEMAESAAYCLLLLAALLPLSDARAGREEEPDFAEPSRRYQNSEP